MKMGDYVVDKAYYFKKGKKDRYVSYLETGKVIIGSNCTSEGFYKLTDINERENVVIAKVVKCLYDYYEGMSYKDFKDLLLERGYKFAFEQPFQRKYHVSGEGEKSTDEMRLVVYNSDLHMIIVADTIYSMKAFNTIDCYCYGANGLKLSRQRLFSHGSYRCAIFDLCYSYYYNIMCPLRTVESYCCKDFPFKIERCDVPSGWTYAEANNAKLDFDYFTDKFLNQCPQDLRDWFE